MTSDLTPERWRLVSAILDEALESSAADREAVLKRWCGEDRGLRADVERLLGADARPDDVLDEPARLLSGALQDAGFADDTIEETPAGTTIGAYKVVREIGRGGMGVVFLADRADGAFNHRVALKVVHAGAASDAERQRFLRERQILATLDHPFIARLFDGGVTPDGRPYFAMEYVEGESLTTFCKEQRLGLEARLRLFLDVCRAVEAAHAHLIVHRDLKPSNILVSLDGRVKLLDFGIARPLGEGLMGATLTAAHAMTPEYAAPEQIQQASITVATDVYGLGVVLYELLAGRRPFAASTLFELSAAVLQQTPSRPSASLESDAVTGWPAGMTISRLRRRFRGDLDTIVLTALRKEPERRYQSVEALRRDIERHLRHEPVMARPDSTAYRAVKFMRRHAVAVTAAVVVMLALVAGLIGTMWQAAIASQQARRAEAAKAFMAGVFQLSDPSEALGETIKAREILDLAARRIDSEFAETPEIQGDMFTLMGRIYTSLGLYPQAARLLERALEIRRRIYPADHMEIGDSLDAMGVLQTREGRYIEAEVSLQAAVDIVSRTAGENSAEVASSLSHLSEVQVERASYVEAAATAERALEIRRRLFGGREARVAETLAILASATRGRGDFERALALDREALDIRHEQFGEQHPDVVKSLSSLGTTSMGRERYVEAENFYRQALAVARRTLGPNHPDTLEIVGRLGTALSAQGRFAAGEVLLREALEARQLRVGEHHPSLITNLNALASTLRQVGEREEAARLYRTAVAIAEQRLGAEHLEVARNLADLGTLLNEEGHASEAEVLLRRAVAIFTTVLGARHVTTAEAMTSLGECLLSLGRSSEAAELLEQSHDVLSAARANHPSTR